MDFYSFVSILVIHYPIVKTLWNSLTIWQFPIASFLIPGAHSSFYQVPQLDPRHIQSSNVHSYYKEFYFYWDIRASAQLKPLIHINISIPSQITNTVPNRIFDHISQIIVFYQSKHIRFQALVCIQNGLFYQFVDELSKILLQPNRFPSPMQ